MLFRSAKKGDIPAGVAGADKNKKTLKQALSQTDPQGKSQVFPQLAQNVSQLQDILSSVTAMMGSTSGGGGEAGGAAADSGAALTAGALSLATKKVVQDSLSGAMLKVTIKYGYKRVMYAFYKALYSNTPGTSFAKIAKEFKPLVSYAILNLYYNAVEFGEKKLPILTVPKTVYGKKAPVPIVAAVPEYYVEVFYTPETDPYPGYVQWLGINGEIGRAHV